MRPPPRVTALPAPGQCVTGCSANTWPVLCARLCVRGVQSGNGFSVDGRRALVAYRRYLMLLMYIRMCKREDVGESGGPLSVMQIERELGSLEGIIRTDAPAFLAGPEEVCCRETAESGGWGGGGSTLTVPSSAGSYHHFAHSS